VAHQKNPHQISSVIPWTNLDYTSIRSRKYTNESDNLFIPVYWREHHKVILLDVNRVKG
jgi:hypothetical protein